MSVAHVSNPLLEEFVDLIAAGATPAELAAFRPSAATAARASELLAKSKSDGLTPDEEHELRMFEQAELMLRLVKARVRQEQP